jgi:acyl carrier protein
MTSPATENAPDGGELVKRVTEVLRRFVTDSSAEITPSTRLFDDLGLDSTNILELLVELESEIGVEFDTDDLEFEHFKTVDSLAGFVAELMGR